MSAPISLRERALRHLARRDHSRAELARKLAPHAEADEIAAVIARMGELGLQSDARYAEAFVRSRAGRMGSIRLRRELQQRGIDAELIAATLAEAELEPEAGRALTVLRTRFQHAPGDAREWARQARFLQARGFAPDLIRKLLKEAYDESA